VCVTILPASADTSPSLECPERVESGRLGGLDRQGLLALPPRGPGHHHVDVAAAAPGAYEPLAPFENAGRGAISLGHLGSIRLDLVAAIAAPHDQAHASRSRVSERHRRAGARFHGGMPEEGWSAVSGREPRPSISPAGQIFDRRSNSPLTVTA
jgi:hypothetical protein